MEIRENRESAGTTKTVLLKCPYCPSSIEVRFPYGFTAAQKQDARKTAVDEHRRVCTGAPPEAQRVYEIHYPRS